MYINIVPYTYFWACLLLLTVPIKWLTAAILSAAVHELSHILLIRILGYRIWRVQIGIGGTIIETEPLPCRKELLCALAGPVGSLLLALAYHQIPRIALCSAVQGLYNLLPVFPMDGGRIVHCIAELFFPRKLADRLCRILEITTILAITVILLIVSIQNWFGILPFILTSVLLIKTFLRKIPCKAEQLRVQ